MKIKHTIFFLLILMSVTACNNSPSSTQVQGLTFQNQPFSSQDDNIYSSKKEGGRVWKWNNATTYCNSLMPSDFSDWRLPSLKELKILLTNNAGGKSTLENNINKDFINSMSKYTGNPYHIFWVSDSKNEASSWAINFTVGYEIAYDNNSLNNVLCVRNSLKE